MKTQTKWRAILAACILGLIAEACWVEEQLFFIFYEPHIAPMSYWGTRLEVIAWTPVSMVIHVWWMTLPLVLGIVTAVVKLRTLKRKETDIRTKQCTLSAGAAEA